MTQVHMWRNHTNKRFLVFSNEHDAMLYYVDRHSVRQSNTGTHVLWYMAPTTPNGPFVAVGCMVNPFRGA